MYNEGFSLRPVLLHPQTRGVVRLQSRDHAEHPLIEPNYLAHPDDIKILVEGRNCFVLSLSIALFLVLVVVRRWAYHPSHPTLRPVLLQWAAVFE